MTTIALALAAAAATPGIWNLPGPGPHLMFHYMPWYVTGQSEGRLKAWDHWSWDGAGTKHDPTHRLPDGRRDAAAAFYPLIGTYTSSDRAVLRYHMQTIRAAGGEAIAIDWNTPSDAADARIPLILDEAGKAGLKVTLCYEEKANFVWPDLRDPKSREEAVANVTRDFNYLLKHYATHPAFLRRNGRPFFFQFNGWGQGKLGSQFLSGAEYQTVMRSIESPVVFGRQGLETEYDSTAPGRYLWFVTKGKDARYFAQEARRRVDAGALDFFVSFVCPGFDDSGVSGWDGTPRNHPRKGLSFLWGTFQNAFAGSPELVQVVTWNDFNEGTVMEPTLEHGFQYLDALSTWWSARQGKTPDLNAIRRPFLDYLQSATPAARQELPPNPKTYLQRRPLTVEDPGLFDSAG